MSFTSDLIAFEKKYELQMEKVLRKVTLDLSAQLIQMSPVDTGRFRNNWYLSTTYAPNLTTTTQTDPSGMAALNRISSGLSSIQMGTPIWITNNLPYATRLEYGWSKQAPAGMVRISAARFQAYLTKAVQEVGT